MANTKLILKKGCQKRKAKEGYSEKTGRIDNDLKKRYGMIR